MKLSAFITALLISFFSLAEGTTEGKINGYVLSTGSVFFAPENDIIDTPSCNTTNRYYFNYATEYSEAFLTELRDAKKNGTTLILVGTGECNGNNAEKLRKICTLNVPC